MLIWRDPHDAAIDAAIDAVDPDDLRDRFPCPDCGGRGAHYHVPGGTMCPDCEGAGYDIVAARRGIADDLEQEDGDDDA